MFHRYIGLIEKYDYKSSLEDFEDPRRFDDELQDSTDVLLSTATVFLLGSLSQLIMHVFNNTKIENGAALIGHLQNRSKSRGIVTVSNHVTAVDDPGVVAALLPTSSFLDIHAMRWTLCARDRCFSNATMAAAFTKGKVLPIDRGEGIYQPGMDYVVQKLEHGQWIHMFPEGRRFPDGLLGPIKRGIGRLVAEPTITPVVIPFYHLGMREVIPERGLLPFNMGGTVHIVVGEPIEFDDLLEAYAQKRISTEDLHSAIADRVGCRLAELRTVALAKQSHMKLLDSAS